MTPTADLMRLADEIVALASKPDIQVRIARAERIASELRTALSAPGEARVGGDTDGLRAERDAALEAARAWRSRFVAERMNAYPNDSYEVCRAKAEDSANQFEGAFKAARLPKEKES